VALGVGALIYASDLLFTAVKILGSGFLVYLGIQGIRHRADFAASLNDGKTAGDSRVLLDSIVVGLTNAKTLVFSLPLSRFSLARVLVPPSRRCSCSAVSFSSLVWPVTCSGP